MSKNLIIYYSRKGQNYVKGNIEDLKKGNTEIVAEYIKDAVGGDLFEVDTVKAYDEDYNICIEEAKEELNQDARPELKQYLEDISEYDNVFICGPCWWGTYPMAVFSLLERLDFTGKNVFPVMTHEGSGIAGAPAACKKYCKGAKVGKGIAIQGSSAAQSQGAVTKWANGVVK